ncbi:MAG TPA: ABC transporter permease [Methanocella sp.]|nr:ABC transporter permease [Methanocella sp.]
MYLWDYRELIGNLVVSDLKIKYADSMLGFAWSLLNPLMMMVILYLVFSNVYRSTQENFVVYLLIGILSWRFFSMVTTSSLEAIVKKESLVKKIYIPREILTLSAVVSGLISSFLEFLVLIPLLIALGVGIYPTVLLFPVVQLLFFLIIYGLSLILSSLYVYFRDLNQIWGVAIQLGFFLCPIVYPLSLVPARFQAYYLLNPVTRVMVMYRDIFLGGTVPEPSDFLVVLAFVAIFLAAGNLIFHRLARRFAEEV